MSDNLLVQKMDGKCPITCTKSRFCASNSILTDYNLLFISRLRIKRAGKFKGDPAIQEAGMTIMKTVNLISERKTKRHGNRAQFLLTWTRTVLKIYRAVQFKYRCFDAALAMPVIYAILRYLKFNYRINISQL